MRPSIKHPDWLRRSKPGTAISLYNEGKLPEIIAGWMIVVGLKHPLRAVYGSDLRAALALLWQATIGRIIETCSHAWWLLTHRKEAEEMRKDAADISEMDGLV